MDAGVVLPIVAGVLTIAIVIFAASRRKAAPPRKPLSNASEARTFVGIPPAGRSSDATMVGPMVRPTSDATVVDLRAGTPAAPAPAAAAPIKDETVATPPRADAPTVAMSAPPTDATAPTIRIPKLRARVTVTKGGSGTHELDAREHTIGRSASADIVLEDPSVSGHHAKLMPRGDAFAVSDLGSTNGTTVDGRAVQGEHVLRGGETVGIGDARLRYERLA